MPIVLIPPDLPARILPQTAIDTAENADLIAGSLQPDSPKNIAPPPPRSGHGEVDEPSKRLSAKAPSPRGRGNLTSAAFRAADLGMDVTLVDIAERPGGVCLFRGCIPSKTFLHLSELIYDAAHAESLGIRFGAPEINLEAIRKWKGNVIDKLANGLVNLSNHRSIQRLSGRAVFEASDKVRLHESEVGHIKFR